MIASYTDGTQQDDQQDKRILGVRMISQPQNYHRVLLSQDNNNQCVHPVSQFWIVISSTRDLYVLDGKANKDLLNL